MWYSGFQFDFANVILEFGLYNKTTDYSKYHRFLLCVLLLAKSSDKDMVNCTVSFSVCLRFTKTKQNHLIQVID